MVSHFVMVLRRSFFEIFIMMFMYALIEFDEKDCDNVSFVVGIVLLRHLRSKPNCVFKE